MAAERERLLRERAELEALKANERAEQEARLKEQVGGNVVWCRITHHGAVVAVWRDVRVLTVAL